MHGAAEVARRAPAASGPLSLPRRLGRRLAHATDSLSLLNRVIAGSALLTALVAGAFLLQLLAMSDLRNSANEQAQSKSVTAATLGLERVVNELEVSLRSFVTTSDSHFLSSWRRGRADLPKAIATLERAVATQPGQRREAEQLATELDAYITEYGLPLISISRISPDAARSRVATQEGLYRINAIRNGLVRLLDTEDSLASHHAATAKSRAARAIRIGVASLVMTAGLLVLFGVFLARGIARPVRTAADAASRVAAGDLSTRLPERGAAEIHTLTRSFNTMARSLEQGKRELEAQNEELRQSKRQMSQLVSIVSHELRTPLAGILGYASVLLTRDVDKADAQHYLEIIHEQGRRLSSLVDKFLDAESAETGRIELKDEPFDLRPLLLEEAELIADDSPLHHIDVTVTAAELPVRGDRDRLAQVFVNLLTNAVKYSPDGGVVEVTGEVDGEIVRVGVRDQGIGVPDEHQTRIFTSFFRGDARESGIAGNGLGLAVSREIVEAHGGRISFTSVPGRGSTFWFELPCTGPAAAEPAG